VYAAVGVEYAKGFGALKQCFSSLDVVLTGRQLRHWFYRAHL